MSNKPTEILITLRDDVPEELLKCLLELNRLHEGIFVDVLTPELFHEIATSRGYIAEGSKL